MKAVNQQIRGDKETLDVLADEYVNYCGRHVRRDSENVLTVLAYAPKKPAKKKETKDEKEKREARGRRPQAAKGRE